MDAVSASPVTEIANNMTSGAKSIANVCTASAPWSRIRRQSAREMPASTSTAETSSPWNVIQATKVCSGKDATGNPKT